jgi:hypothetical protein
VLIFIVSKHPVYSEFIGKNAKNSSPERQMKWMCDYTSGGKFGIEMVNLLLAAAI